MSKHEPLLVAFRFHLSFRQVGGDRDGDNVDVCSGAFAECSGLEATMEPRVIKVGGLNYGAVQRAGPVAFATVILRRGMTSRQHLFDWFQSVAGGAYALRRDATIEVRNPADETLLTWGLDRCLPVKFKAGDLNARSGEVAIEELHLAHQGLRLYAQEDT